ncbi:unnamed protein product [Caenorhabditis nigoni]
MTQFARKKKWKFLRFVYLAIFVYLLYRTLAFIHVLYLNHRLGSPMDFSEMMLEKEPRKFLEDFVKFQQNFIPFDFQKIAAENEKTLQEYRKIFIQQSRQIGSIRK